MGQEDPEKELEPDEYQVKPSDDIPKNKLTEKLARGL